MSNININLYYWNNGVGVVNDAILIKTILTEYDVITYDISKENNYRKSNLGIFIQNIQADQLENNKKNILIINEEWLNPDEILFLKQFDHLIVKSNYAKELLKNEHQSIIQTGFFSIDKHFFPRNTGNILHFKGKSIQKNTNLVKKYESIKILDTEVDYLTESQVMENLNSHDIHICCSLYEGWGHYLWEAMSCGKLVICSEIPVFKEYLDPKLVKFIPTKKVYKKVLGCNFLDTAINYKFRQGYFVDRYIFELTLKDKDELLEFQKKNSDRIRNHFLYINKTNKDKFLNTIKFIL